MASDAVQRQGGSQRKPPRQPFGHRHDVWFDASLFKREKRSGSSKAALHFIGDEQKAMFFARASNSFEELARGDIHATLSLDGFNQDGDGFAGNGGLEFRQVVKGESLEPFRERFIYGVVPVFSIARRGGGQGSSMKGVMEGENVPAPFAVFCGP